jgi:regulatory protein
LTGSEPKKQRRVPPPVDRETLERAALRYLDRFDASVSRLRRVLQTHVRRAARVHETDQVAASEIIEALLGRYVASGLLSDRRYAENLVTGLRARGASQRQITHKLRVRGVAKDDADAALTSRDAHTGDAELRAASELVRKKKLGPYRKPEERQAHHRADLARLARAGFDYELARRVLGPGDDDAAF